MSPEISGSLGAAFHGTFDGVPGRGFGGTSTRLGASRRTRCSGMIASVSNRCPRSAATIASPTSTTSLRSTSALHLPNGERGCSPRISLARPL